MARIIFLAIELHVLLKIEIFLMFQEYMGFIKNKKEKNYFAIYVNILHYGMVKLRPSVREI